MSSVHTKWIVVLAGFVGIAVSGYLWLNRGYGSVSRPAYEFATAIYGVCLSKDQVRLEKVARLLSDETIATTNVQLPSTNQTSGHSELILPSDPLVPHERKWLKAIIALAWEEKWESAAAKARRMMQDQVQFRR